MYPVLNI